MCLITLRRAAGALAVLLLVPAIAQAHPGHGVAAGLQGGLVHPFTGWDHLLAMLAVGFWAAGMRGYARWALPVAFAGAMAFGFALGIRGAALPGVEPMVAASVLVLGLAICGAVRLPVIASASLVAVFGLVHGAAHGIEAAGASWRYGGGMVIAASALMAAGYGAAAWTVRREWRAARVVGAVIAALGAVLVLT